MGKHIKAPIIRCLATEETQVSNVYATIYYNLSQDEDDPPLSYVPNVDVGVAQALLPGGGKIKVSTASSSAKDGDRETFLILDESHLYTTPELKRMYRTTTRNIRKRKKGSGTWFLETTTMFASDEDSMAKATYEEAEALREGRKKRGRHRLLFDHRWGECKDLSDEPALRVALREAYGDAMAWMDEDSLVDEFYDLRNTAADSRRFFLNARTSSTDAWIPEHEWAACKRPTKALKKRDMVTLGLDGAVRNDATALVACRVSDGHVELLGLWEQPEGPAGEGWQVDREAVDAAVANAFRHFEVVGFYMDPAHWQDYADKWGNEFGDRLRIKASQRRAIEWWTNRPVPMSAALERFAEAVADERVSYTPPEDRAGREAELALALTRHVLNARQHEKRGGIQIRKERDAWKIDAAVAATLAYECACDARAAGVKPRGPELLVPRRIR